MSSLKHDKEKMKEALQYAYEKVYKQIVQGNFIPKMSAYVNTVIDHFVAKEGKASKRTEPFENMHASALKHPEQLFEEQIQMVLSDVSVEDKERIKLSLEARSAVDLHNRKWRDLRDDISLKKPVDQSLNLSLYWETIEKLDQILNELSAGRANESPTTHQWVEAISVTYKQVKVLNELKTVLQQPSEGDSVFTAAQLARTIAHIEKKTLAMTEHLTNLDGKKLSIEDTRELAPAKQFLDQGKISPEPKPSGDARELSWIGWYFVILNRNGFCYKTINSADTAYKTLISGIREFLIKK